MRFSFKRIFIKCVYEMKIDTPSWEPSSVCNMKIRCPPCSHVSRPSIEDYVAIHDGAPPFERKHCDELYWQESLNLLHFRTRCWWIFVGFFFSFFFFSDQYIFPNLKLIVTDNLVSRISRWNFVPNWTSIGIWLWWRKIDRIGDDSKSKGKPRARKNDTLMIF